MMSYRGVRKCNSKIKGPVSNSLLLSQPVTPVLCLLVIVRVKVTVMYDNSVSCCEVNTQTTSTRGQQEDEDVLTAVKLIY